MSPLSLSPHMHRLPRYRHLPPKWCICYNGWTYITQSPEFIPGSRLPSYLPWVWTCAHHYGTTQSRCTALNCSVLSLLIPPTPPSPFSSSKPRKPGPLAAFLCCLAVLLASSTNFRFLLTPLVFQGWRGRKPSLRFILMAIKGNKSNGKMPLLYAATVSVPHHRRISPEKGNGHTGDHDGVLEATHLRSEATPGLGESPAYRL